MHRPWPPISTVLTIVTPDTCPIKGKHVGNTEWRFWGGGRKPNFLRCNVWWEYIPEVSHNQVSLGRVGPWLTFSRNQPDYVEDKTMWKG